MIIKYAFRLRKNEKVWEKVSKKEWEKKDGHGDDKVRLGKIRLGKVRLGWAKKTKKRKKLLKRHL